jgi:branched-chain amino acid transport system substrate-binding protein
MSVRKSLRVDIFLTLSLFALFAMVLIAAGQKAHALETTKMSINGFEGTLEKMDVPDAIRKIRELKIGEPAFLKEPEDVEEYGIQSSIGGILKRGEEQVQVFELEFKSEDQACSSLEMKTGESPVHTTGPLVVEDPMNCRNLYFGLFFDGTYWTGFRRDKGVLALMKGALSQEDFFHIMEKVIEPREASASGTGGPIKIGLIGTFSGPIEEQGINMRDGALLALDEAGNKEGLKGRAFELVIADDKGTPGEAVVQAKRLIEEEGVSAIVGPFNSSCALALVPVVSEAKVPMITLATHPALTKPLNRYVFRGNMSDDDLGKLMVDYATIMLGAQNIAVFYEDSPYGKAGMEVIAERLGRIGKAPVAAESYISGNRDFSAQMAKFKEVNTDTIMVYGTMVDAQTVMQWIRTSGLDVQVIASSGWASTELLPTVPKGLDGVIVAGYAHLIPDSLVYLGPARIVLSPIASGHYQTVTGELEADQFPAWPPFYKAFREKFGRKPDLIAGFAYSNVMCLLEGMERVNFDAAKIVEGLEATENFPTVLDNFINYHDEEHDGMKYINFSKYQAGRVALATRDKSLDATKMREKGVPLEVAGYKGELFRLPPNTAAFFAIHMSYGYPPFMKQKREMGMYGGFRSDQDVYGMKYAYSGFIQKGNDKIMMVKMSFRSPERAMAMLNLDASKEALGDRVQLETKPEEMRTTEEGVSFAEGLWSAYERKGATIVFAKGEVPLEDVKAAIEAAL